MPSKPFYKAAQENQAAIAKILQIEFEHANTILEIGSGTGQHAVYFCQQLPHLTWQPSDLKQYLPGIKAWIDDAKLKNIQPPIELDVCQTWPKATFDGAFAANVAHIMHWPAIEAMFAGISQSLNKAGIFCIYGPFNENGVYTSESNRTFDTYLQSRDPDSRIRDKQDLNELAIKHSLKFHKDWPMPANNKILSWTKI